MHRITLNIYLGALPLSQQSSWFYLACCSCHVQTALHNSVVYRDLFDTKLMDCLMPRPGEVVKKFEELYAKSPQEATDYFYKWTGFWTLQMP